jgi:hypothetical protein
VYVTASGDDKVAVVGPRERRMGVPSTVRVAVSTTCTFPVPESVT